MGNLFAHNSFLVNANKAEEDGIIHGISADLYVKKGEYILTDQNGHTFPVTGDYFKKSYTEVEKVEKTEAKRVSVKSPFEEQYEKALIEFNQLELSNEEDESYINELKNLSDNKQY